MPITGEFGEMTILVPLLVSHPGIETYPTLPMAFLIRVRDASKVGSPALILHNNDLAEGCHGHVSFSHMV